jgi:hypothetical protein
MCYEARKLIEHVSDGCSEMKEKERKGRGEKLNKERREIGRMK